MATETVFEGSVGFDGPLEKDRESARLVKVWQADPILFSDLGSGASDSILLGGSLEPAEDIIFCGISARAGTPDFAGEADLAFQVGFEGGDTDALVASTNLNATGDGATIAVVSGVVKAGALITTAQMATLAVLFTATELDDVTAGSLVVKLYYMQESDSA